MKLNATQLLLLHIKAAGLPQPELEYRFAPPRRWRFDLAWHDVGELRNRVVAVEIDGGTFSGGRHVRGLGYAKDCEKLNAAMERGWWIFRYTPQMVESGEAISQLKRVLQ